MKLAPVFLPNSMANLSSLLSAMACFTVSSVLAILIRSCPSRVTSAVASAISASAAPAAMASEKPAVNTDGPMPIATVARISSTTRWTSSLAFWMALAVVSSCLATVSNCGSTFSA